MKKTKSLENTIVKTHLSHEREVHWRNDDFSRESFEIKAQGIRENLLRRLFDIYGHSFNNTNKKVTKGHRKRLQRNFLRANGPDV